jgi:hypothetical protein
MEIKCPYCEKIQKQKPKKTWGYGTMIETKIKKKLFLIHQLIVLITFVNVGNHLISILLPKEIIGQSQKEKQFS